MNKIKDFDIQVRIRNNQILERRERLGLTQAEAAALAGVSHGYWCRAERMNERRGKPFTPFERTGEVSLPARNICDLLGAEPEDLWPDIILQIRATVSRRKLDRTEVGNFLPPTHALLLPSPDDYVLAKETSEKILGALEKLSKREAHVITRHFGLDGDPVETLESLGSNLGLCTERVRQIECRALRRLRHVADE